MLVLLDTEFTDFVRRNRAALAGPRAGRGLQPFRVVIDVQHRAGCGTASWARLPEATTGNMFIEAGGIT